MRGLVLALACATALVSCSQGDQAPDLDGEPVGIARLVNSDPERRSWTGEAERPLVMSVWYPAAAGVTMAQIEIPPDRPVFVGGPAARNAEIGGSGKLPLILVSHGTGGSGMQMMWLGRGLAERGYIVAAVDHHGNTAAEPAFDPRGFRMPWHRALDISRVIDLMMADPLFGPRIDETRIGAAGFSLGGYTVTALAGGRMDLEAWERFCNSAERDATCDPQSEYPEAGRDFDQLLMTDAATASLQSEYGESYADVRIRSIVALAPALAQAFDEESLAAVLVPFLILAGDEDTVAPVRTNAAYLSARIPGAELQTLEGAAHYTFLNPCNARGKRHVPICADPEGLDRSNIHAQAVSLADQHFQRTLGVRELPAAKE